VRSPGNLYVGTLSSLKTIAREEGVLGLFKARFQSDETTSSF